MSFCSPTMRDPVMPVLVLELRSCMSENAQKNPLTPGDSRGEGSALEKRGQARKQEARACKTSKKHVPAREARKQYDQYARGYQRQLESKRQEHARRARSRCQREKLESMIPEATVPEAEAIVSCPFRKQR